MVIQVQYHVPISARRDWIDLHIVAILYLFIGCSIACHEYVCNVAYSCFWDRRFTLVSLVPVVGKETLFYRVWKGNQFPKWLVVIYGSNMRRVV